MKVNNEIYHYMGDKWYLADDHPVALLRSESRFKTEWIRQKINEQLAPAKALQLLDVGCGAGFFCNEIVKSGFRVCGVDIADDALKVARDFDTTGLVDYRRADATRLPFADGEIDIVVSLDFLEHIETPEQVIIEISRVLKPGGLFFYHTFNRSWLSYLIAIKGVEWFVRNTPKHLHLYSLFIRPEDLSAMCMRSGLETKACTGLRPRLNRSFFHLLRSGRIDSEFSFCATQSRKISYLGMAKKRA